MSIPGTLTRDADSTRPLRLGLTAALKARDRDALAALRTAIAAIDNAEAVSAPDTPPPAISAHITGARSISG